MKKTKLIVISIISTIILVLVLLSFLTIKKSKSCDQFVIDTYELISGINIPKQTNSKCFYDEKDHIRVGIYTIRNSDDFINQYEFEKVNKDNAKHLWSQNLLIENNAIIPDSTSDLFQRHGGDSGDKWQCIVDMNSGKMWFEVKWKE